MDAEEVFEGFAGIAEIAFLVDGGEAKEVGGLGDEVGESDGALGGRATGGPLEVPVDGGADKSGVDEGLEHADGLRSVERIGEVVERVGGGCSGGDGLGVGIDPSDGDEGPGYEAVRDAMPGDFEFGSDRAFLEELEPAEEFVLVGAAAGEGKTGVEFVVADDDFDGFGDAVFVGFLALDLRAVGFGEPDGRAEEGDALLDVGG